MNDGAIFRRQHLALLRLVSALLALVGPRVLAVLPEAVRRSILLVLRPAESAGRRLILVAARGLSVAARVQRQAPSGPIPKGGGKAVPSFALFDPRKRFPELSAGPGFVGGFGPRISGFDEVRVEPPAPPAPPRSGPSDRRLVTRLRALHMALEDMPGQARRLARLLAKRRAAGAIPRLTQPLRPGLPPGHRQRRVHAVDDILAECVSLVFRMPSPG